MATIIGNHFTYYGLIDHTLKVMVIFIQGFTATKKIKTEKGNDILYNIRNINNHMFTIQWHDNQKVQFNEELFIGKKRKRKSEFMTDKQRQAFDCFYIHIEYITSSLLALANQKED